MIVFDMIHAAQSESVCGLLVHLALVSLAGMYLYRTLDVRPELVGWRSIGLFLGPFFLLVATVGFWPWLQESVLIWLGFFLLSLPYLMDMPMRLTLSFSLMVIYQCTSILMYYVLAFALPLVYWAVNPFQVHPSIYICTAAGIALSSFLWGRLCRHHTLRSLTYRELGLFFISLLFILVLNIFTFRYLRIYNPLFDFIPSVIGYLLLFALFLLLTYRQGLASSRGMQKQTEIALSQLHADIISQQHVTNELLDAQHDFQRHLTLINQLLHDKQLPELEAYLQTLLTAAPIKITKRLTGNTYIDTVLSLAQQRAEEAHIKNHWHIQGDLPQKGYEDIALALSNLLDNAIFAAEKLPQALLTMQLSHRKGVLYLRITNSYLAPEQPSKRVGRGIPIAKNIFARYLGYIDVHQHPDLFEIEGLAYLDLSNTSL